MREATKRKLIEGSGDQLAGVDESRVMLGQTGVTPMLYLLILPLVFIFIVRSRAVAASDTHVFVIEQGQMKQSDLKDVRAYPIASTQIEVTALSVKIAGEDPIYALLGQGGPRKEIAALVERAGSAPVAETA